ncbi:MAG: excinuclease ABC subunit UvrA [Magnetococcales bacterium]|nr:excinuclease ABC subunit UvrA [Magnetococcales bacterium]
MTGQLIIRGARQHNLKGIDLDIPRHTFTVITGVSGSGKSSLAFDTLAAEGQRRYVESLSAYARQFLSLQDKPDVDLIEGLSPSIAIEQKSSSRNPRSTVGTVTEIYDYLRLLYARIGHPFCTGCGQPIESRTISQMVDTLSQLDQGRRLLLLAPIVRGRKGEYRHELSELQKQGFTRVLIDGESYDIDDRPTLDKNSRHTIEVVVDRLIIKSGLETRLADSLATTLKLAQGVARVQLVDDPPDSIWFSERHACIQCNISYPEIEPRLFSFNSPFGACSACDGLGSQEFFDPQRLLANGDLSLLTPAIQHKLQLVAKAHGLDWRAPWCDWSSEQQQLLFYDTIIPLLERRYQESDDEPLREQLRAWRVTAACDSCQGQRLRPEALAIRIGNQQQQHNIVSLCGLPLPQIVAFFNNLVLPPQEQTIAQRILKEVQDRLHFLIEVGLDYLTLSRSATTLSGGETQRIRLANQIGSGLVGVLYILDEPSIGLHPRDNQRLLQSLLRLRDLGNSVIVVEHDEEAIRAADFIVDLGPGPGQQGGYVVAAGPPAAIIANPHSLTGQYLSGAKRIETAHQRRAADPQRQLTLHNARANNLRGIDVSFPLGLLICITGVSGSGKSSLVIDTLHPALLQWVNHRQMPSGDFDSINGLDHLDKVIHVDQSPIGRTPRSNPATYTGLFTPIRELFAALPEARSRGYDAGRFSFNIKGGRCEACQGEGLIKVAMHFLPDLFVLCDICGGQRYNRETLEILYRQQNIAAVLEMTIEQAADFFQTVPAIRAKVTPLLEVGLGYLRLGQAATTLSGGEAQRVKIAKELARRASGHTLYLLDEPTTGLHFDDIRQLLHMLQHLVQRGNSVVVIEHNLDVIKNADWIIDLGPEGGSGGGELVACGPPEQIAAVERSWTGKFLKPLLHLSPFHPSPPDPLSHKGRGGA